MKGIWAGATLFLPLLVNGVRGQLVAVGANGKSGPPTPTTEYCAQVERLRPNLTLKGNTNVRGRITDQTMAPFQHSPLELRRFFSKEKQVTLEKVLTDGNGNFDLGQLKPGEYRLLLSPHRGFKQPDKLECPSKDCALDTVLVVNPTDGLAADCPIR